MSEFTWPGFDPQNPGHQTLRSFLVLDIQSSEAFASEFGQGIAAFQNGARASYAGAGNGYEFACHPEGMHFAGLYDADPLSPVVLDYATVLAALDAWCAHCAAGLAD